MQTSHLSQGPYSPRRPYVPHPCVLLPSQRSRSCLSTHLQPTRWCWQQFEEKALVGQQQAQKRVKSSTGLCCPQNEGLEQDWAVFTVREREGGRGNEKASNVSFFLLTGCFHSCLIYHIHWLFLKQPLNSSFCTLKLVLAIVCMVLKSTQYYLVVVLPSGIGGVYFSTEKALLFWVWNEVPDCSCMSRSKKREAKTLVAFSVHCWAQRSLCAKKNQWSPSYVFLMQHTENK